MIQPQRVYELNSKVVQTAGLIGAALAAARP